MDNSILTEIDLLRLRGKYHILDFVSLPFLLGESIDGSSPGEVVFYATMFKFGVRFPLPLFLQNFYLLISWPLHRSYLMDGPC